MTNYQACLIVLKALGSKLGSEVLSALAENGNTKPHYVVVINPENPKDDEIVACYSNEFMANDYISNNSLVFLWVSEMNDKVLIYTQSIS